MSRRALISLAVLVALGGFLYWSLHSRPIPLTEESPFHPSSADLIATTGRPQLLEFFHKA